MAQNSHRRGQSISAADFYENPHLSCLPEPLTIRKTPSQQLRNIRAHSPINEPHPLQEHAEKSIFPPRASSVGLAEQEAAEFLRRHEKNHGRQNSDSSGHRTTISSTRSRHHTSATASTSNSVARSTGSNFSGHYSSGASAEIMGNFVPVGEDDVQMSGPLTEVTIPFREAISKTGETYRAANPYEFEPDSPYLPAMRQTKFGDFPDERPRPDSNPRTQHVKNARSEGDPQFMTREASPPYRMASPGNDYYMTRSESSPNVSPGRNSYDRDALAYYEDGETMYPVQPRGRARAPSAPTRNAPQQSQESVTRESFQHSCQTCSNDARSRSPNRSTHQRHQTQQSPQHTRPKSPSKTLQDVAEADETDYSETPTLPPQKRSRSPMKKMFGEHGWLGKSPDEVNTKTTPKPRKEKVSMINKLRNKLGEIAEKADLSPMSTRTTKDKHPKISVLSVSLSPPQQARIYMELELMLVHTVNTFLMLQFSQGRMAVDSIKKTVDGWKSRGRPVVIEFMYDQATQRELVVANQNNFRFHGERAGDEMRIASMLYNWKQVASLMAIRTFCDADTIILKLLFDIEQILEFVGAPDPLLYRLQQLRASSVEMMRVSRLSKDSTNANVHGAPVFRDTMSSSNTLAGESTRKLSFEEAYGGMKLVPDSYNE